MLKMFQLIPGWLLEKLYYSKVARIVLPIYDYLTKNQTLKLYKIYDEILIEVDLSKPAERAIPFNAYEPKITKKFLAILREGDVVFDVGAWIGYYVLLAAKKAERVIAIEADDKNCQRIRSNIELNHFSNVMVMNIAAGDKASNGFLLDGPGSSMNKVHAIGYHEIGKTIRTESLDNIISNLKIEEINLLIMDVEGYEYFALKGLDSSLRRHVVKNIICEIHPSMLMEHGVSNNDVLDLLYYNGYLISNLEKNVNSNPYHIYAKVQDP